MVKDIVKHTKRLNLRFTDECKIIKFCINKILIFSAAIILCGCALNYNIPEPENFKEKSFVLNCDGNKYLLYINSEFKFALFDTLGTPKIVRVLNNDVFENTKFLPYDSSFDDIFIGILIMIDKSAKTAFIKGSKKRCEVREI